jgi:hypothetical protein
MRQKIEIITYLLRMETDGDMVSMTAQKKWGLMYLLRVEIGSTMVSMTVGNKLRPLHTP